MLFTLKIALRYLIAPKEEKFVTAMSTFAIFAVAIGVFSLIITLACTDAMKKEMISSITKTGGEIVINCKSHERCCILKKQISKLNFIKNTYIEAISQTIFKDEQNFYPVYLCGLEEETVQNFVNTTNFINTKTSILPAFVSQNCAKNLDLYEKQIFSLTQSTIIEEGFNCNQFQLIHIFTPKSDTLIEFVNVNKIFTHLQIVQKYFIPSYFIQVQTHDPENADVYSSKIRSYLETEQIYTWKEKYQDLMRSIEVERNCMIIVLVIILILSSLVMMSSLFVLVREKISEICILKTIGARKKTIVSIFLITGILIGSIGIISGGIVSYFFIIYFENIKRVFAYYSDYIVFKSLHSFFCNIYLSINYSSFYQIILLTSVIIVFASIYPAYQASKVHITKGIKM